MKRSLKLWQFVGFAVTSFTGTLLHFLYEISGNSPIAAIISGVNESTWEHMKLLFFPMFAFAIVERIFLKDVNEFWCIKLPGICLGLALIPLIFYTYNGVIGRSPDAVNIAIFYVAALASYIYETKHMTKGDTKCTDDRAAFVVLCLIALSFVIFTFRTPKIAIFKDPIKGVYGL